MRQTPRAIRHDAGFSIVEMLIGLVIGMVAVIVMMQVFSVSEGYRRTTTGGDDAQNNGAIALYALQRDVRQSGYGFSTIQVIGCNVTLRAGVVLNAMSPVTINHPDIPAADGGDTLLVVYGNAAGSTEGESILAKPSQASYTIAAAAASASSPGAFAVGDRVIGQFLPRPTPCALSMEPVTAIAGATVSVAAGVANTGGVLYNLGQTPKILVYAVRRGNLTVCDYMASDCSEAGSVANSAIWVPIASNIVSLRAQYGRDTAPTMKATVDTYDQAAPATACDWARILAVRFVLVARSSELDKNTVTNAAPTWSGAASQPIDLSGDANWQRFRYKTFQTVVPLRNMAWQGAQTGC
jgi:type IV pilus assembly protein PilW